MKDNQEIRLAMLNAVKDFINENTAALNSLPNFSDYSENLDSIISQLNEFKFKQGIGIEGITVTKSVIKTALVTAAFEMSRRLVAYAKATGNSTLRGEVDFTLTDLNTASGSVLKDKCELLCIRAEANLEDLTPFNVTEELISRLAELRTEFIAVMPKPKTARTNQKLATERLKVLFDEGDHLLREKMDAVIDLLRFSDLELYKAYRETRVLKKEYGFRKLAVKVTITDSASMPIGRVEARIEGSAVTKKTSDKGRFQIDLLPAGTYTFNFSRGGYKPLQATVVVIAGITTKLNMVMEKIAENIIVPV